MIGAVASHQRSGDPVATALPAAILVVVLFGLAYARRRAFLPARAVSAVA